MDPTDYAMKKIRECFENASRKLWADSNKEAEDDEDCLSADKVIGDGGFNEFAP